MPDLTRSRAVLPAIFFALLHLVQRIVTSRMKFAAIPEISAPARMGPSPASCSCAENTGLFTRRRRSSLSFISEAKPASDAATSSVAPRSDARSYRAEAYRPATPERSSPREATWFSLSDRHRSKRLERNTQKQLRFDSAWPRTTDIVGERNEGGDAPAPRQASPNTGYFAAQPCVSRNAGSFRRRLKKRHIGRGTGLRHERRRKGVCFS